MAKNQFLTSFARVFTGLVLGIAVPVMVPVTGLGQSETFELNSVSTGPKLHKAEWQSHVGGLTDYATIQTDLTKNSILTTVTVGNIQLKLDPIPRSVFGGKLSALNQVGDRDQTAEREALRIKDLMLNTAIEMAVTEGMDHRGFQNAEVDELGRISWVQFDPDWLARSGLRDFSVQYQELPGAAVLEAKPKPAVVARLKSIANFLNQAILISTWDAMKEFYSSRTDKTFKTDEWGIHFILKGTFQVGIGKMAVTYNLPGFFSIGWDRQKKRVIVRKGYRKEAMQDGLSISAGLRAEFRFYRRMANTERISGSTWAPPFLPLFAVIADTGRGYHAEGLSFGPDAAEALGTFLFNNSTGFEEVEVKNVFETIGDRLTKLLHQLRDWTGLGGEVRSCEMLFDL